ncbi:class I SAM-dependent methyltransferase [Belliella sp. DSM 111904]|uniref:Class I SAM-dependent methyltransferase n=1 Tax=Belliella filtrata TaxID=2923435 RepID=A0ABS9V2S6_9BACT|nr:class I SAM-dependent methyltransferase [Belliella filtrata]MCH7410273.1 class I SAM-dependent methyltransferase [Belliella filtrata]
MDLSQFDTESFRQFVQDHLLEDPAHLLLKYAGKTDFDLKFAVQQIQARQKAKHKIPTWTNNPKLLFPISISMEQASSEETAQFKSNLLSGQSMIDLTGGLGVDTYFLSKNFQKAIYCERQEALASLAAHNFSQLDKKKFEIVHGDSLTFLENQPDKFDLIYLDPARRGENNQKLYKLTDCEPNVVSNWSLLKSKTASILIKASPMLDIKQAITEISEIQQVWIVSVKNEVKEVLLLWEKSKTQSKPIQISCIDLHPLGNKEFNFTHEEENLSQNEIGDIEALIIEPMASIMKAGAFKTFGSQFSLKKLHANSHLYTTQHLSEKSIPGKVFKVLKSIESPKKELKNMFLDGKVNVITRNYLLSADELKKKYKLRDGGDQFLIGTKVGEKYRLILTELL